jgi:hypothetical protein
MAFSNGQSQPEANELSQVLDKTGDAGDEREDPDGDVHGLLGPEFIREVSRRELRAGVSEEEDRAQPADFNSREAQVFLDQRQKCKYADSVKIIDQVEQPDDKEDYMPATPDFFCSFIHGRPSFTK